MTNLLNDLNFIYFVRYRNRTFRPGTGKKFLFIIVKYENYMPISLTLYHFTLLNPLFYFHSQKI